MDYLDSFLFFVAGVSLVFWEFGRTKFIQLLKREERNLWNELGKPSGFFISYLFKRDSFRLEFYIFKKQFLALSNSRLMESGKRLYLSQLAALFAIGIFFIYLIINLATYGM